MNIQYEIYWQDVIDGVHIVCMCHNDDDEDDNTQHMATIYWSRYRTVSINPDQNNIIHRKALKKRFVNFARR